MYLAFALVGVDRIAGALLNVDVVAVRPSPAQTILANYKMSNDVMAHNTTLFLNNAKLKIVKNWKTGEAKTLGNWEKERYFSKLQN